MLYIKKYLRTAALLLVFAALITTGFMPDAQAADANSQAGVVTTSWGALNVRTQPDSGGTLIYKLPSGTYVTLLSKTGNWWYVEYAPNQFGYASADFLRVVDGTYPRTVLTASGNLNVRSGPGTSFGLIGSVSAGKTVLLLSESEGWSRILYNGSMTGYVSSQYLRAPIIWPVPASRKINQYFSGTHNGVDIGASVRGVPGDDVIAVQSGKAVYAGWLSGYGYVVYINSVHNGQTIQMRYAHLNGAPRVSAGSQVTAGQLIGNMGNSGTSTGVHLHFEVRIRSSYDDCLSNSVSTPINPLDYIA